MGIIHYLNKKVKRDQKTGFSCFTLRKRIESSTRSKMLNKKKTEHEKIFESLLLKHGIHFFINKPISLDSSGTRYRIADFYLPSKKVLIEIDGKYHEREHIKQYDMRKDSSVGFRTFRYTNEDVEMNGEFIVSELKRLGF
jgi:very-short-patch-repair endonuclease